MFVVALESHIIFSLKGLFQYISHPRALLTEAHLSSTSKAHLWHTRYSASFTVVKYDMYLFTLTIRSNISPYQPNNLYPDNSTSDYTAMSSGQRVVLPSQLADAAGVAIAVMNALNFWIVSVNGWYTRLYENCRSCLDLQTVSIFSDLCCCCIQSNSARVWWLFQSFKSNVRRQFE